MKKLSWWEQGKIELKEKGYQHALITQAGVSYSTATLHDMERLILEKDIAYHERNKMLIALCRMAQELGCGAGIGKHEGADWDDEWKNIIFLDLPTGQVSWHIHDSEVDLFHFLPPYRFKWDGHTTDEKWRRVFSAYT